MASITKTRIKIFRDRPRSSWEIPVPVLTTDQRPYVSGHRPAEEIEKELLDMGFKRAFSTQSFSHYRVRRGGAGQEGDHPDEYVIWIHPAGVVARAHTFQTRNGDVWKAPESMQPVTTFERICFAFALEFPEGVERRHQSACNIPSSGGTESLLDGREVRVGTVVLQHFQKGDIGDWLGKAQKQGRFIPLEHWPDTSVYVDSEMVMPFQTLPPQETPDGECLSPLFGISKEDAQSVLVAQLPPALGKLVENGFQTGSLPKSRWAEVEAVLKEYTTLLAANGKQWLDFPKREVLEHWSRVALGELGEDVASWRPFEKGPAGLSLPVALIHANDFKTNLPRLVKLFEAAPQSVVNEWARSVDKAGFTVPLRLLCRAFCKSSLEKAHADAPALLEAIEALRRCSTIPLRWETPQRTPRGLLLEHAPYYGMPGGSVSKFLDRHAQVFWEVLMAVERQTPEMSQELRWRTHPNTMTPDKARRSLPEWIIASPEATSDAVLAATEKGAPRECFASIESWLRGRELGRTLPAAISVTRPRF